MTAPAALSAALPELSGTEGLRPETVARLETFVALLGKWNASINLVSRDSLSSVWSRHVLDSLQLVPFFGPAPRSLLDLGSGAGFPGMVLAIALADTAPGRQVTLVEADRRKAEFLRTVSRETGVPVTVIADRIEALPPQRADILTARALAPLAVLCNHAHRHLAPGGRAFFPKGAQADAEIAEARRHWIFEVDAHPSQTDPAGSILVLSNLQHA